MPAAFASLPPCLPCVCLGGLLFRVSLGKGNEGPNFDCRPGFGFGASWARPGAKFHGSKFASEGRISTSGPPGQARLEIFILEIASRAWPEGLEVEIRPSDENFEP